MPRMLCRGRHADSKHNFYYEVQLWPNGVILVYPLALKSSARDARPLHILRPLASAVALTVI